MDLGMNEILLVLLIALLIYGGRLPEVARSLGRGLATLRRSLRETTESVTHEALDGKPDSDTPKRPRTVRRVAPKELAEEDVSGEGTASSPSKATTSDVSTSDVSTPVASTTVAPVANPTPSAPAADSETPRSDAPPA